MKRKFDKELLGSLILKVAEREAVGVKSDSLMLYEPPSTRPLAPMLKLRRKHTLGGVRGALRQLPLAEPSRLPNVLTSEQYIFFVRIKASV